MAGEGEGDKKKLLLYSCRPHYSFTLYSVVPCARLIPGSIPCFLLAINYLPTPSHELVSCPKPALKKVSLNPPLICLPYRHWLLLDTGYHIIPDILYIRQLSNSKSADSPVCPNKLQLIFINKYQNK